jgi:hypothetical protein
MSPAAIATKAAPGAARSPRSHIIRSGPARRLLAALGSAALVAGLVACTSKDNTDPSTWPDGTELVAASSEVMGTLTSVHLRVDLEPPLGSNPAIKRADLDLTNAGDTKGDLEIQPQGGAMTSLKLITLGATAADPDGKSYIYLTGTGWIEYAILSETYDTAALLRPGQGLSAQLSTATEAKTVGSEKIDGVDSWKVSVTFDNKTIEALVPAELGDHVLTGEVWLAKDSHYMVKAAVHVPANAGVNPASEVTLTLSNFNQPVEISAPVLG